MSRRYIFPLVLGLLGTAILVSLGVWQLQRLDWKKAILADIDARIAAAPVALPEAPDPEGDRYLPVAADGVIGAGGLRVLVSRKGVGAGFRIVTAFETGGRRVLLDRGFVPEARADDPRPGGPATVVGNLHWPDEVDSYTPPPDAEAGMWFGRDLKMMAEALGTEPVLIVARGPTGDGIEPMPVTADGIPNDHLQYAVTWFGLAAVWVGMTAFLLWRIRQRRV